MKRWISLLLIVALALSVLPRLSHVHAAEEDPLANREETEEYVPTEEELEAARVATRNGDVTAVGIDVSSWQGWIDWDTVATQIDFAILRCGYGGNYSSQDDSYWERNVSECERLGIPYGVYLYSYAISTSNASSEADHVIRLLEGHDPDLPVFYDLEDSKILNNCSTSQILTQAKTFARAVEAAGYEVGMYANLNWWRNYLPDSTYDQWMRWVAQYNSSCTYTGEYKIWQYTSSGSVSGISGNVDMNYMYGELPWTQTPPDPTTTDYSGNYYIAAQRTSGNYYYLSNDLDSQQAKRYVAVDSGTTSLPDSVSSNVNADLVWTLTRVSGSTYKLSAPYNHGNNYAGWTEGNTGRFVPAEEAREVTLGLNGNAINIYFDSDVGTRYLSLNGTTGNDYFAFYGGTQKEDLTLIPVSGSPTSSSLYTAAYSSGATATCTRKGTCAHWYCTECETNRGGDHYDIAYADEGLTMVIEDAATPALGHLWDIGTVTTEATCASEGVKLLTCTRDGCEGTKEEVIPTSGIHNMTNHVCSVCGYEDPLYADYSGDYYIGAIRDTEHATYLWLSGNLDTTSSTKHYCLEDSGLTILPTAINTNVTPANVWTLTRQDDGTYLISAKYNHGSNYIGWSSGNSGILVSAEEAKSIAVIRTGGVYEMTFPVDESTTRWLSLQADSQYNYFAFYANNKQVTKLSLVPVTAAPTEEALKTAAYSEGRAATCTTKGLNAHWYCATCQNNKVGDHYGKYYTDDSLQIEMTEYAIAALGHLWDEGVVTSEPTCAVEGERLLTCTREGCEVTKTEAIATTQDHVYVNNVCSVCGKDDASAFDYSGNYYIAAIRKDEGATYQWMTNDLGTASTKRFTAVDSGLSLLPVSIDSDVVAEQVWTIAKQPDGSYFISSAYVTAEKCYVGWSSSNSANLVTLENARAMDIQRNQGIYTISFAADETTTRWLSLQASADNNYFAFYANTNQIVELVLIPVTAEPTVITYDASFVVPEGAIAPEGVNGTTVTLPEAVPPVSNAEDYVFVGWGTSQLDNVTTEPTLYAAGSEIKLESDMTFYAVYSYSDGSGAAYTLVTDTAELSLGASVVIAAAEYDVAMATQNTNNRTQAAITKNTDHTISFPASAGIAELTLGEGVVEGSYSFFDPVQNGYLYAASSSSNYLKTQSSLSENSSWAITVTNGIASVVAQGDYTHNILRYNSTSSLFSAYASSQKDVVLYQRVGAGGTTYYTTVLKEGTCMHSSTTTNVEVEATCTTDGSAVETCDACGQVVGTTVIAAPGHSYDDGVVTEPTTTEQGYTTYTCTGCGHSYVSDYVDYPEDVTYIVSFVVPTNVPYIEDVGGDSTGIVLPIAQVPLGDYAYTFVGWAESTVNNSTTAPTIYTGTYYPTADTTLYAVYSYVKEAGGTSEIEGFTPGDVGDYVIATYDGTSYYAVPTAPTLTSGRVSPADLTVSTAENGTLYVTAADAAGKIWTIAKAENGYTISDGTKYLYHSNGGSSGTSLAYGTRTDYTWSFTADGSNTLLYAMNGSTVSTRGMLYRTGYGFAGYAMSNVTTNGYYKTMLLPIYDNDSGSTTYYTTEIQITCTHSNASLTGVQAATCTEAGYSGDTVCSDCGETVAAGEALPALGHSYNYTNNGDNHTVTCGNCDYSVTEGHNYVDGTCVCGAVEVVIPDEPTELAVKIGHTASFDSDLKLNYRVKYTDLVAVLPNYVTDGAYLVVEKDQYLASGETSVATVTLYPDLTTDVNRMVFNLGGIQSVEMGSELRAVLHIFDADGNEYYTPVDVYSILAYAESCYKNYSYAQQPQLFTMLIDALNYGSAAQIYFGRRADELVNAGMDAYQQYATTSLSEELNDSRTYIDNDRTITAVTAMGFSVTFADKTEMNAKLTIASGFTKDDITCVKVLNSKGEVVDTITDFTELSDGRLQVTYYGVKSIQMREMFQFVAYVGDQVASQNVAYSVEAYAKSNVNSSNTKLADMVLKCMYYGDAAYAYFNR